MNQTKTIIRNIFSNWTGYLVSVVIGLILSPIVVHSLGNNLYGIWTIIVAFSGYYGLVNLGITPAVSYYLSHHYGRGEYEQINQVASNAFSVLALLSFVVLGISMVVGWWGASIFSIDAQHVTDFKLTVFIMALNFALGFVFAVFQSFFIMLQRYDLRNGNQIFFDVLRAILIYLALKNGYKIIAISIITALCTFCSNIIFAIIIYRIFPQLKLKLFHVNKEILGRLFNYGFFSVVAELGRQLMFYSAAFVIGIFLNTALITFFAIAGNLVDYARNLLGAMTRVFFPVAVQHYSRSEFDKLQELCLKGSKYAFSLSAIIIIGFLAMGKQFIILWMGKDYTTSYAVLQVLCVGYLLFFLSYTPNQILLGAKKMAFIAKATSITAFLNIFISVLLVNKMGIIGVAWGTSISLSIQSLWLIVKCSEMLNISISMFFNQVVLGPLLCSVPVMILGLLFQYHWFAESWSIFVMQTGILSILYGMMATYICVDQELRRDIVHRFINKFPV